MFTTRPGTATSLLPNLPRAFHSESPANFNAEACPILARHWFGLGPFRSIGGVAAEVVADLRFQRQVQRLHHLGPRAVGELLAEIGVERGIRTVVDQKLERYTALDPKAPEVTGGDTFWPVPPREIRP